MCTDNAAMVAAAGWWRLAHDGPSPLSLGPTPTFLGPHRLIDSRARVGVADGGRLRCGYAASEPSSRPHLLVTGASSALGSSWPPSSLARSV